MRTGIIVYSNTGNTLKAAMRLLEALRAKGREAELLQVKTADPHPEKNMGSVQLTDKPSPDSYDRLVFAAPVWAFNLCGVMKAYLAGLGSLKGKQVSLFVTHQLPLPWMGGTKAVRQMKAICEGKGGKVDAQAVICWGEKRRETDIAQMLGTLS